VTHLVFLPHAEGHRPAEAHFFLWQPPSADPPDGGERSWAAALAAAGRRATVPVVTEAGESEDVEGQAIPIAAALPLLAAVPADDLPDLSPSIAAWSLATKLALDLIARERLAPVVTTADTGAEARWGISLTLPDDADRFRRLARAFPPAAHAVSAWSADDLLLEFFDALADLLASGDGPGPDGQPVAPREPSGGPERWERRLVRALTEADGDRLVLQSGVLERGLIDQLVQWAAPARGSLAARGSRLCLKLDPPDDEPGAGANGGGGDGRGRRGRQGRRPRGPARPGPAAEAATAWRLGFYLQAADDPSLLLPAREVWAATPRSLEWMDRTLAEPQELLLRELARAGRVFPPIRHSLEARNPEAIPLDTAATWRFLSEVTPALAAAGVGVILPAELSHDGQRRLQLRMRVGGASKGAAGVVAGDGFTLEGMVDFRWEAAVGDQSLTPQEFEQLVALKRPLVRWRGQWVVIDPGEAAEVRRLLQQGGGRLAGRDALTVALRQSLPGEGPRPPASVVAEGPLGAVLDRLRRGDTAVPVPPDLSGELRPYQERGLGWLVTMATLGLGGCLADDMGLGKTVQAIAFLLARRQARPRDRRPTLIVCPTSVVGNWERELARFSPTLPVVRYHGAGRPRTREALAKAPAHAVVVTTYGTLRLDRGVLAGTEWGVAILDEAQNVKNANAQQAAAARALRAAHRFALTGTPVENRLAELWSILEYCTPGFLGPLATFRREYAVPIERYRDDAAADRLRRLVRPFVLRRLKADVATELPPKQEIGVVCSLTREQATLYQATVEETMAKIEATDGIERRGLVLALLTALKQICNHPANYLHEKKPLAGRSGKLARLGEMLEESVAAGDRALVFTQFREMGDRLLEHLRATLDTEILYLHGGTPRAARDEMVRRFQEEARGPAVFLLSLRAGGTGLNLTRASRVFHFDRWWNPAVEDQATDRAHRIGQDQVVQVYRLLTAGTIEEKIDQMLADKRALADRIVGEGEAWITELPDDELRRLVALGGDAEVEEDMD
jgi:superfamily II DNA or RNA helicase